MDFGVICSLTDILVGREKKQGCFTRNGAMLYELGKVMLSMLNQ